MKKIMTLAAMFAAVMVSFSSCEKNNGPQGGNNDVCEDCGEDPCVCEEYVPAITIDGDFADWDAVQASVAYCDPDAKYTALTTLKAYADAYYVYVYVEFDEDQITDRDWPGFHIYFNADNSDLTGGFGDQWSDANAECMLETAIFSSGEWNNWDAALFKWWGEVGGSGWLWTDPENPGTAENAWGAILGEGSGISSSAGNGNAFEIAIMKEMMMGVEFADTFSLGVDIQQKWTSVGILPNAAMTEENANGLAPKLVVNTVK